MSSMTHRGPAPVRDRPNVSCFLSAEVQPTCFRNKMISRMDRSIRSREWCRLWSSLTSWTVMRCGSVNVRSWIGWRKGDHVIPDPGDYGRGDPFGDVNGFKDFHLVCVEKLRSVGAHGGGKEHHALEPLRFSHGKEKGGQPAREDPTTNMGRFISRSRMSKRASMTGGRAGIQICG